VSPTAPAGTEIAAQREAADLRRRVENFLYYDADLLDRWDLAHWLELFTPDCLYLVPATDCPDGDPDHDLFLIRDDHFLLSQRINSILEGTAWAESPRATTHRMITNVRARQSDDGLVDVQAKFLIHRARGNRLDAYPGTYEMRLVQGGNAGFYIRFRRAILAMEELRPHGRVSILL
jgi:p-cumate 2,3-dioxygenase beta subunit